MAKKHILLQAAHDIRAYAWAFVRWAVLGTLTGACGGVIGAAFSKCVEVVTDIRGENGWLLYLLPLGGLLITAIYKLCHVSGVGTNEVFQGVRSERGVSVFLAPAIFVGTVITHLLGGSAGREGAALQLGGSVASFFGKVFRLNERDRHILTMCGMSAVFSAVFGTPMGACIFAVEVVFVGKIMSAALYPCMVSSISAFWVAQCLGAHAEHFNVTAVPKFGLDALWRVVAIAAAGALVSILFCWVMHTGEHLFRKHIKNEFVRVFAGGVTLVVLSVLIGTSDYNGGGMHVIERVFEEGIVRPEAFLLKMIFTAITIGAGYKGGEIVPTLFIGSTMGGAIALLLGMEPGFGAAVGIAALFCGVTNCPITTILLCIELFSGEGALFYLIAAVVSFLLSGSFSLYSKQELIFSKLYEDEVHRFGH